MLQEILEAVRELLALGDVDLSARQMALRAIIIYLTAIVLVKVGQKRFMGRHTAFDMIVSVNEGVQRVRIELAQSG